VALEFFGFCGSKMKNVGNLNDNSAKGDRDSEGISKSVNRANIGALYFLNCEA